MLKAVAAMCVVLAFMFGTSVLAQSNKEAAEIEKKFLEYTEMTELERGQRFRLESPKVQAQLYRRNILEGLQSNRFNEEQVDYLIRVHKLMTEAAFIEGSLEQQALAEMQNEAMNLFSRKDLQKLFRVAGIGKYKNELSTFTPIGFPISKEKKCGSAPVTTTISFAAPVTVKRDGGTCYCNESWECLEGYRCEAYYGNCTPGGECGWIWTKPCRGACKYVPGGEA